MRYTRRQINLKFIPGFGPDRPCEPDLSLRRFASCHLRPPSAEYATAPSPMAAAVDGEQSALMPRERFKPEQCAPVDIVLCSSLPDLAALERLFEKQADKVRFVDSQHADLAPTEIEAAAGGTVSGFFCRQTWLGRA